MSTAVCEQCLQTKSYIFLMTEMVGLRDILGSYEGGQGQHMSGISRINDFAFRFRSPGRVNRKRLSLFLRWPKLAARKAVKLRCSGSSNKTTFDAPQR